MLFNILFSGLEIFGIELIDSDNFLELLARFSLNFLVSILIVRYLYYQKMQRKDYLFTYLLISTVVFMLCFLLENVKLQLGFALGLFAIFGIIRYRTINMPIKEMTYLFIVIGVSVINALSNKKVSYAELLFTNFAILAITWALEKVFLIRHETRKTILYEKIDLIKLQNRKLLIDDLQERTGLKINRVEVGQINFLNDTARVRIYYYESENRVNPSDDEDSYSRNNDDE